jgi:hypothetical protein
MDVCVHVRVDSWGGKVGGLTRLVGLHDGQPVAQICVVAHDWSYKTR